MANSRQPVTYWPDPLTDKQLIVVLRELATLAGGDPAHDIGTVLDVYNDRVRLAGRPELPQAACHQLLGAVRASIPSAAPWPSDLMVVNEHLYSARRVLAGRAAGEVLPEILETAAVLIEARHAREAGSEVDDV
jgi:hypothetical protein